MGATATAIARPRPPFGCTAIQCRVRCPECIWASSLECRCPVGGGVVWWAKGWRNVWGPEPTVMLPVSALLSSAIIAERFLAAGNVSGSDSATQGADS